MGEAVQCAHCRRPIAAHFTTCPFCHKEQPQRVGRAGPVKCTTCHRPYNPSLPECPFCARDQAGYREKLTPAAPSHEEYKQARAEVEEAESRLKTILLWTALGSAGAVLLAIAISGKVHAAASTHLGVVGAIGFVGGVAAAIVGPRFVELEGPTTGRLVTLFLGGSIASAAVAYVVLASLMLGLAGHPIRVRCEVTRHGYPKRAPTTPATTGYSCKLPDGTSFYGVGAYSEIPVPVRGAFTLEIRRAPFGFLYEPSSARIVEQPF